MCLTIIRDELKKNIFQKIFGIIPKIKPLIAKKDIICYKVYKETDIPMTVKSPFRNTFHLVGKPQPIVEIGIKNYIWEDGIEISEGYHSFVKFENPNWLCSDEVIYQCTIPKGSTYYIGEYNTQYVSNQLIINKKL